MHRALAIEIRHPPRPHRSQLPRDEPGDDGSDGGQSRGIERHRDASTYALVSIAVLSIARVDFQLSLDQRVEGSSPSRGAFPQATAMPGLVFFLSGGKRKPA